MIRLSLKNLLRNKSRSFLTTIGIIIGVAAIVSLVSISNGIESEANLALGSYQYIVLMEEGAFDDTISRVDESLIPRVSRVRGVSEYTVAITQFAESIGGRELGGSSVASGDFDSIALIIGIEPEKADEFAGTIYYYDVKDGRMLEPGESGSILVTTKILEDYDLFIGSFFEVNGENFRIVGTVEVGGSLGNQADMIVMEIQKAKDLVDYEEDKVAMIQVLPQDLTQIDNLITRLEQTFEGELQVFSSETSTEILGSFLGSLTIGLWVVSGIAGVVGAVGVMNTMLMSVMERIQEFGVLKAVGWKNIHIIQMIVGEALIIGLFGGIVGVLFGFVGSELVELISGIPTAVSFSLIVQVLVFSSAIGIGSSIYPAIIASRMSPVEAVTYE